MNKFEKYLKKLANHEVEKSKTFLHNPRNKILVHAGIRLNWLGDFLANPDIKWEEKEIPIEKILFSGTNLDWNKILIDQCKRSPRKFLELIERNSKIKAKFRREAFYESESILVRASDKVGFYRVLDGMHRFVGAVLIGKKRIKAFIPKNEKEVLPICEPHVVYDLIRAFQRNAKDKDGKIELYYALKLLCRTYANVEDLLCNRFDRPYIHDNEVQEVVEKVLRK